MTLSRRIFTVVEDTVDCRYVSWCRQVFDNRIQHCLHAFVFKGRTTGNQNNLVVQHALTQSFLDFFLGQLFAAQVFFHQLV
ncbi:hypothetical protein D3C81_1616700 [compost metagenome]